MKLNKYVANLRDMRGHTFPRYAMFCFPYVYTIYKYIYMKIYLYILYIYYQYNNRVYKKIHIHIYQYMNMKINILICVGSTLHTYMKKNLITSHCWKNHSSRNKNEWKIRHVFLAIIGINLVEIFHTFLLNRKSRIYTYICKYKAT